MASLEVRYSTSDVDELKQAYALVAEVTSSVGVTDKIFVYHRDTENNDIFECVADPVDIYEYPEDFPDISNEMPYFRVNKVTLLFRSLHELVDTKKKLSSDIAKLAYDVTNITDTPITEDKVYDGTAPTDYF